MTSEMRTNALVVSIISIFMYSLLFYISVMQYLRHSAGTANFVSRKYLTSKRAFFAVLAASSFTSLPLWLGCAIKNGPSMCQWNDVSFPIVWSLHLLSLVGYSFCLGVPTILWSDILHGRDHSFFSKYAGTFDSTRIFFTVCLTAYLLVELLTIMSIILFMDVNDPSDFLNHNDFYKWVVSVEPFIILLFAGGCLFNGIALQIHVLNVRLDEHAQRRLLILLNFVLAVVTTCYTARAVFVFNLYLTFSTWMQRVNFLVWTICTHWLPQIVCSFCLAYLMSRSASNPSRHTSDMYHSVSNQMNLDRTSQVFGDGDSGPATTAPLLRYVSEEDSETGGDSHLSHVTSVDDDIGGSLLYTESEGSLMSDAFENIHAFMIP